VDTSLAELAREAVERGEQEEREPPAKPVSASGRKRLEVLLEDLISLKDEIDEALWESEDEES
ncbi:MAG TPA: MerR family transcriptional regulator, partial [Rhodobiaceae bacterium]|nr:MerR family transcriptional regulator [Rhodobiaceae bacterium]